MEFFLHYFLPFTVALTILVFIHELGHYYPARKFGIRVEVFSIGFGPELFGYTDKAGTRWKFSLIPLGGYVRMFGDANAASAPDADGLSKMKDSDYAHTLQSKTPLQRTIVSAGGPFANFVFAIVAMIFIFGIYGVATIPAKIGGVKENSIAATLGLEVGDEILAFNGEPVIDFMKMREQTKAFSQTSTHHKLSLKIKKANKSDPVILSLEKPEGFEIPLILGIIPTTPVYEKVSIRRAVQEAFSATYEMSAGILHNLGQVFKGQAKGSDLGGILSIGDMAGKSAQASVASFVMFLAILSINLGLINLFPLPMLDGGHIVFHVIEGIFKKPVPLKVQEKIFTAGFFLLASLMVYVTWNDLMRYKIFQSIQHLFS